MIHKSLVLCLLLAGFSHFAEAAVTTDFESTADNTLYESATGALSNGAGQFCFVGTTSMGTRRRAVMSFDLSSIPAGSQILSATLTVNLSQVPMAPTPTTVELHRLTAMWGESTSDAGTPGGNGTAAAVGDATWIHTESPGSLWATVGGDFVASASSTIPVNAVGSYTWGSTSGMVADVQGWIDGVSGNFGWLLMGDETANQTARRFDTREHTTATAPTLSLIYLESIFANDFESGDTNGWGVVVP